jgi:large subunit ribosomal protein L4
VSTTAPTATSFAARRREAATAERHVAERRSMDGTVLGGVVLDPEIFGIVPNTAVLHQVITAQLAAARAGTQSTRTRAEVKGGGSKPFRQKGTGRSRQGSIRSPQWVGGGVALGPKPRKYEQRTPKKMIRLALRSALSDRARLGRVAVVDEWGFDEPRTRDARLALEALDLRGRVLVVTGDDDAVAERSFRNLPRVEVVPVVELNAYDILRCDWILFSDDTLPGTAEHTDAPAPAESGAPAPRPLRAPARRAGAGASKRAAKGGGDTAAEAADDTTAEGADDTAAEAADDTAAEAADDTAAEAADETTAEADDAAVAGAADETTAEADDAAVAGAADDGGDEDEDEGSAS